MVEEGNLPQQVLVLRRALANAGDWVATVPRYGYRFVAPVVEERRARAMLDECDKQIEGSGRQRDGCAVALEATLVRDEPKGAEPVGDH